MVKDLQTFLFSYRGIFFLVNILFLACSYGNDFKIRGNEFIQQFKLEEFIAAPESSEMHTEEDWDTFAEETHDIIADLYAETGFFDVEIKLSREGNLPPWLNQSPIHIDIKENKRYLFGPIEIHADVNLPLRVTSKDLQCVTGKNFYHENLYADKRSIIKIYAEKGFPYTQVSEKTALDTIAKLVKVEFMVSPGRALVFDTLLVRNSRESNPNNSGESIRMDSNSHSNEGLGLTPDRQFRKLLPFNKGDTVSFSDLNNYEKKMKSTRVFNFFRIKDSVFSDRAGSALVIHAEERIPGEVEGSLFYETQYGAGISSQLVHSNIWGDFHEARIGASIAQKKQHLDLGYSSALFFGSSLRFDNDFIVNWYQDSRLQSHANLYAGDFDIADQSKLSRSFNTWSRFLSTLEFKGESRKMNLGSWERSFNLNYINALFFAFVDEAANPNKGLRFSLTWGNGGPFIEKGGVRIKDSRHNWFESENAFYWPFSKTIKLATRLNGGRFYGGSQGNAESFFLGGPRSIRSYGWREICPKKMNGICQTEGLLPAYFLTSFELRLNLFANIHFATDAKWKFLTDIQWVPFVDYGRVWDIGNPISSDGKAKAYGLGIRYTIFSIFNLRIDYAQDGWNSQHSQWVLDLAQAF